MSLLSEDKSLVAQALQVTVACDTTVDTSITTFLPISSGLYRQVVGYAYPRNERYTYVLNVETGEPLEFPEGFLPTLILFTAVQQLAPNGIEIQAWYVDSPTDPDNGNKVLCDNLWVSRINAGRWANQAQTSFQPVAGVNTNGYRWLVLENTDLPDVLTAGVVKVVQAYQLKK